MKYRRVDPARSFRSFRAYFVNTPRPPGHMPHAPRPAPFQTDGWIHPRRAVDTLFDVSIRVPGLGAGATTTQRVFEDTSRVKAGVIRKLGYSFSQPHGYLQVRTTVLVNGAPSTHYIFRTVDAASGAFEGSLPPFQIGGPAGDEMAEVFIEFPAQTLLEVRFVNASATEAFSCDFRVWGWMFGG